MDVYMTRHVDEMIRMMREHVRGLQRNACTRGARIVLVLERNYGGYAQGVGEAMVNTPGVRVMAYANADGYGVYTLCNNRNAYAEMVRGALRSRAIALHREPLVCECPYSRHDGRAARTAATLAEFERQMRNFQMVVRQPRVPTSSVSVAHTGKVDRDKNVSSRFRDDMVLAMMLALFYGSHHANNFKDITTHGVGGGAFVRGLGSGAGAKSRNKRSSARALD